VSADERDDYQADIRFGEWLRSQRVRVGMSLEDAAKSASLSVERLKGLEMGLSERGITRAEAVRISKVYQIGVDDLLAQAARV
jgi:hypothetical protein